MLGKQGRRDEACFTEGFDTPISRRMGAARPTCRLAEPARSRRQREARGFSERDAGVAERDAPVLPNRRRSAPIRLLTIAASTMIAMIAITTNAKPA
jgi:hypothetical protein